MQNQAGITKKKKKKKIELAMCDRLTANSLLPT